VRWKLMVDHQICVGSGTCTAIAPNRFVLNADDHSDPVAAEIEEDQSVLEAAHMCPTGAISLHVAETGEPVWPDG
jgi:ferredoxin